MIGDTSLLQTIAIALTIGAASGAIGSFILLKRMALVGDALSHVALPGVGLAIAYGIDPFWGVLTFCIAAGVLMWWLEERTEIPSDALVGLLFTASLAIGILTIPDTEIVESLFGTFSVFSNPVFLFIIGIAICVTIFAFVFAKKFLFLVVSQDLARVHAVGRGYNLALFIIFVLVVALGIKLVGTLLMGALTIIPAATARNISRSMRGYMMFSAIIGGGIGLAGVLAANTFRILPGPAIIIIGIVLFLFSLGYSRARVTFISTSRTIQ